MIELMRPVPMHGFLSLILSSPDYDPLLFNVGSWYRFKLDLLKQLAQFFRIHPPTMELSCSGLLQIAMSSATGGQGVGHALQLVDHNGNGLGPPFDVLGHRSFQNRPQSTVPRGEIQREDPHDFAIAIIDKNTAIVVTAANVDMNGGAHRPYLNWVERNGQRFLSIPHSKPDKPCFTGIAIFTSLGTDGNVHVANPSIDVGGFESRCTHLVNRSERCGKCQVKGGVSQHVNTYAFNHTLSEYVHSSRELPVFVERTGTGKGKKRKASLGSGSSSSSQSDSLDLSDSSQSDTTANKRHRTVHRDSSPSVLYSCDDEMLRSPSMSPMSTGLVDDVHADFTLNSPVVDNPDSNADMNEFKEDGEPRSFSSSHGVSPIFDQSATSERPKQFPFSQSPSADSMLLESGPHHESPVLSSLLSSTHVHSGSSSPRMFPLSTPSLATHLPDENIIGNGSTGTDANSSSAHVTSDNLSSIPSSVSVTAPPASLELYSPSVHSSFPTVAIGNDGTSSQRMKNEFTQPDYLQWGNAPTLATPNPVSSLLSPLPGSLMLSFPPNPVTPSGGTQMFLGSPNPMAFSGVSATPNAHPPNSFIFETSNSDKADPSHMDVSNANPPTHPLTPTDFDTNQFLA